MEPTISKMEKNVFFEPDTALVTFEFNDKELYEVMNRFQYQMINRKILYLNQANNKVSIITANNFAEALAKAYETNLMTFKKGLVAITLMVPEKTVKRPGFIADMASKLAKNSINIFSIMTVSHKITFVIDEKELFKAKKALNIS